MDEKDALWVVVGVVVGAGGIALVTWLWLIKGFHGKNGSW